MKNDEYNIRHKLIKVDETSNSNDDIELFNDRSGIKQQAKEINTMKFIRTSDYHSNLPNDINIFSRIDENIDKIENKDIYNFIKQFLTIFQETLISIINYFDNLSNYLPPLTLSILDDGSVLIEWIFKDFRVGFSIEPHVDESSWYMVTNQNLEEFSRSGKLELSKASNLLKEIIMITLKNT
jgi:hypothetical protein